MCRIYSHYAMNSIDIDEMIFQYLKSAILSSEEVIHVIDKWMTFKSSFHCSIFVLLIDRNAHIKHFVSELYSFINCNYRLATL